MLAPYYAKLGEQLLVRKHVYIAKSPQTNRLLLAFIPIPDQTKLMKWKRNKRNDETKDNKQEN